MVWDGQMLRVEFSVTRYQGTAKGQTEAVRYPAARLVLSAAATNDLVSRLQQTMTAVRNQTAAQPGQPDAAQPTPPAGEAAAKSP